MFRYLTQFSEVSEKFLAAIAFLGAIVLAIVIHEYAHGFAAYKCGDATAKFAGRLTLNPLVHFNLFGLIMFVIVGFGFANPVPINPNNFKKQKRDLVLVSLAGVIANFLLAFLSFGILAGLAAIIENVAITSTLLYYLLFLLIQFLYITISINLCLMIFNLLPLFPLDGFRLIEALTPRDNKFVVFMRHYGVYIFLGLILIGAIIPSIDILSMYIGWVQRLILKLFALIFKSPILGL